MKASVALLAKNTCYSAGRYLLDLIGEDMYLFSWGNGKTGPGPTSLR